MARRQRLVGGIGMLSYIHGFLCLFSVVSLAVIVLIPQKYFPSYTKDGAPLMEN